MQDRADAEHLRAEPADVDGDHPERGIHAGPFAVFALDDVGHGQTLEPPQQPDDEDAGEDQADRCAERVGQHTADAVGINRRRDAHARPGAEPGRQQCGGGHPERQAPPGDQKVVHSLHLAAGPEADSDQYADIGDNPDPEGDHSALREHGAAGNRFLRSDFGNLFDRRERLTEKVVHFFALS